MEKGQEVSPSPGERIICVKSGLPQGSFIFDLELAPGVGGPPMHSHDEGDEIIEVREGLFDYKRVGGRWATAKAGDTVKFTSGEVHTFRNGSKTDKVICRVTHGPRFERVIAQPGMVAMSIYATDIDPGASRVQSSALKFLMWVIARVGTLLGARVEASHASLN